MTKKKAKHARLSPSASARWIACPPSVDAGARQPREESGAAAREGTLAHAILEAALLLGLDPMEVDRYEGQDVPEDMQRCVGHAVNYVHRWQAEHPQVEIWMEKELNPGEALDRDDMYGTSDLILVDRTPKTLSLEVVDYKHGKKPVAAENNSQLMSYAVGALLEFFNAEIRKEKTLPVKLVVVQPRVVDFPTEWDTDSKTLMGWMNTTVQQAATASDNPSSARSAGDHCRWCRAAGTCRELTMQVFRVAAMEFDTEESVPQDSPQTGDLDAEEIAYALSYTGMIQGFLDGILTSAQRLMLDGQDMPGYKLVYRRTRSSYTDKNKVVQWVQKIGLPIDDCAPRDPLSRSKMKRVLDKYELTEAQLKAFNRLVIPPKPEIAVAPVSDSRKPVPLEDYGKFKEKCHE